MSEEPLNQLGDYEILCALKSGGMGQVFLGRKIGAHGFERMVAIKTMLNEIDGQLDARTMFLDEARLVARLDHPAIAQIFDFGEIDNYLYIVLEYVAGVSMSELLKLHGTALPPRVALDLIAQVCRGLHAAHQLTDDSGRSLGVVHRDVSPQNIMVGFSGAPKVIDFGIALHRARTAPVTEYGMLKGKPCYMAPEQFKSDPIDRRVDVFAACVVLYEALTHRRLFGGNSVYAIAKAVCERTIRPPSRFVPRLLPDLDAVVMRGLERNPLDRYGSCAELAAELEKIEEQVGGANLRQFVEETLGEKATLHSEFIGKVRSGKLEMPTGKREGQKAPLPGTHRTVPLASSPVATRVIRRRPRRKSRAELGLIAFALAVAIAVSAAWFLWFGGEGGPEVVAITPAPTTMSGRRMQDLKKTMDAVPVVTGSADRRAEAKPGDFSAERGSESKHEPQQDRPARRGTASRTPIRKGSQRDPPKTELLRPKTPKGSAQLTFLTRGPYAVVRLDGKTLGVTPKMAHEIESGTHLVEFLDPKSNELRYRTKIRVAPGEHKRIWAPKP